MNVSDKYKKVFGEIESLSAKIPWTTGLSNMVEYLVWDTKSVLGISKAAFWNLIVDFTKENEYQVRNDAERVKFIEEKLKNLQAETEAGARYDKPRYGYCSAREALRRNKYFSEDYLNKEFDIFMNLCSDKYLDYFYGQFIELNKGGSWSTHGNSGLFSYSVRMDKMQMDNLAYNEDENLLIANELKLGSEKNRDQILKYCYMFRKLEKGNYIKPNCRFMLLFIGGQNKLLDIKTEINKEIVYCRTKDHLKEICADDILDMASNLDVQSISWGELIIINETYIQTLNNDQQVEKKLLSGFNATLREKAFTEKAFVKYSS